MSDGRDLRVVHALPGRLRVRVKAAPGDGDWSAADALAGWEQRFRDLAGVRDVVLNRATGSLLVHYDPEVVDLHQEFALGSPAPLDSSGNPVEAYSDGEGRPAIAPASLPARAAAAAFWKADTALSDLSGGNMDLKLAVPAALLGAGLWELAVGAEVAGMSFHVLAWYAYNLFYQLHPREMQYR